MYRYRIVKEEGNNFLMEELLTHKSKMIQEEDLKGYAAKGLVTNVIVRNNELFKVYDALEAYLPLSSIFMVEGQTYGCVVDEEPFKGATYYKIRVFSDYDGDITHLFYRFVYAELNLRLEKDGSIGYLTKHKDPLEQIRLTVNKKAVQVQGPRGQQGLVPEKDEELVTAITSTNREQYIKAMQEHKKRQQRGQL